MTLLWVTLGPLYRFGPLGPRHCRGCRWLVTPLTTPALRLPSQPQRQLRISNIFCSSILTPIIVKPVTRVNGCQLDLNRGRQLLWLQLLKVGRSSFVSLELSESVPIQLAQCRFPRLAISNAKILIYFSNKIYGSNFIKQHSETVIVWNYQNANCGLRKNVIVSFIIIFGTLSFPIDRSIYNVIVRNITYVKLRQ